MNPESPSFSANAVHLDGNAVVMLVGELDIESAPQLASCLGELTEGGPPEIVLDLSNLDFIDSSGLAVLIAAQGQLRARGRHLSIRSPRPLIARILAITNLAEYLNLEASESIE